MPLSLQIEQNNSLTLDVPPSDQHRTVTIYYVDSRGPTRNHPPRVQLTIAADKSIGITRSNARRKVPRVERAPLPLPLPAAPAAAAAVSQSQRQLDRAGF